ncbi:MAG: DUF547 domain-containing protein [Thermodesulfobacteriota bacterium]|nr:DUF547 domain-containing protein [Thermodesulfobacteriota bacterium]
MKARGPRIGLFLFSLVFCSTIPPVGWSMEGVDQSLYKDLLAKYVKEGVVDYRGFKEEEEKLDQYLKVLEKTDTTRLTAKQQLAFYINAYNAWTIKLILSAYPGVESIWDLGSRIFKWKSPFRKEIVRIEGKTMSLDDLEHGIIRPRFKDPRIHFAVNCASKSCPPLLSEPYRGSGLDRQLNQSVRAFLNDPKENRLEGETLHVSKIFKWFAEDFNDGVVGFFLEYAEGTFKERIQASRERLKVKYLDYDWGLNGT